MEGAVEDESWGLCVDRKLPLASQEERAVYCLLAWMH